jgi:hypothetical protein
MRNPSELKLTYNPPTRVRQSAAKFRLNVLLAWPVRRLYIEQGAVEQLLIKRCEETELPIVTHREIVRIFHSLSTEIIKRLESEACFSQFRKLRNFLRELRLLKDRANCAVEHANDVWCTIIPKARLLVSRIDISVLGDQQTWFDDDVIAVLNASISTIIQDEDSHDTWPSVTRIATPSARLRRALRKLVSILNERWNKTGIQSSINKELKDISQNKELAQKYHFPSLPREDASIDVLWKWLDEYTAQATR